MFWDLNYENNRVALIDTAVQRTLTYGELATEVQIFKSLLSEGSRQGKQLGFVYANNSLASVAAYVAALQYGDAVLLLNDNLSERLRAQFETIYQPEWVFDARFRRLENSREHHIHDDLAILLPTSGTTGSQKLVRLSYRNLQANADSIAEYLSIDETERAITTLPMSYSYGLSVLNSHLNRGASLLLTNESVLSRALWDDFKNFSCTSFAGVPYTYQLLKRLNFHKMDIPSLRYFTQAGGRLPLELGRYFLQAAQEMGKQFTTMYGQTEATARMSYVPFEKMEEKLGAIGVAIPGGHLEIDPDSSELIYSGPNVMMGYAESRLHLAYGDQLNGQLRTGDLASVDTDGYFTVVGRLKRFVKLFGLRVNLDDVERMLERELQMPVTCVGNDERMYIVVEGNVVDSLEARLRAKMQEFYKLHSSSFKLVYVDEVPKLPNGKVDFKSLESEVMK